MKNILRLTRDEYPNKKSYFPKNCGRDYLVKFAELNVGLFLCAVGLYFTVQANIGLAPWMALNVGFENLTGINYGLWNDIIGIVVLVVDILMKEKTGFGTLGDCFVIGLYITLFDKLGVMQTAGSLGTGIVIMLIGIAITGIGSYYICDSAFAMGPRDSLMIGLAKRIPKLTVGQVRILLEASVLVLGWLMGAKISVGTLIYVVGIGYAVDIAFYINKFDAKRVLNEDVIETVKNIQAV
ncbi:MAG: hypothetical protein VZQ84_05360 [Anaerovoracaceae bacterium]|nr:hypothetical protein [Anaerovoracaceae bacterium]